jgi:dihydroorotate dehydrogenase
MILFNLVRPLFFAFDSEDAHRLTINALKVMPVFGAPSFDSILSSSVAGLEFPSPIGLAAGFDKDGEVPRQMLALGFGSVEIGSLTPQPQAGNPRPRLFRLREDQAVINRMGFNNKGHAAALKRLGSRRYDGIVGINIGANKDAVDRIADYAEGVRRFSAVASYLTVNVSSPNTPGLRALQDVGALTELLDAVAAARASDGPPLFLKLAPDLESADIDAIARTVMGRVDGLIMGNTTISRPDLASRHASESGGLSGRPLAVLARQRLIDFRKATGGAIPLIAVGGIDSGAEAYARIRSGAALVQLYSAMVYQGPGLAWRMSKELAALLRRDGFTALAEAVGADV